VPRETVRDLVDTFGEFGNVSESAKAAASHNDGVDGGSVAFWRAADSAGMPYRLSAARFCATDVQHLPNGHLD
jgi:hypothetical protein